jgi:hypothetical protein
MSRTIQPAVTNHFADVSKMVAAKGSFSNSAKFGFMRLDHFAGVRKMVGIRPLRACPRNGQGVRA